MSDATTASGAASRRRRPPPAFRRARVVGTRSLSPRLRRITLGGGELDGFAPDGPGASLRVVVPNPGTDELVVPTWTGNEFLLPDGSRPVIRTLTPGSVRGHGADTELDLDIVAHRGGALGRWATEATPGDPAAVSGPGKGYALDPSATRLVVLGDETAIPAIGQLLATTPAEVAVEAFVEAPDPSAELAWSELVPGRARPDGFALTWLVTEPGAAPGGPLLAALAAVESLGPDERDAGTRVWAAGEAAAMQRLRTHLFETRGVPRPHTNVRGYWVHGRPGVGGG